MRLTISKEEAAVLISALDYEFEAMRDREASMGNPPRVWVEKMSTNRAIVDMLDQGIKGNRIMPGHSLTIVKHSNTTDSKVYWDGKCKCGEWETMNSARDHVKRAYRAHLTGIQAVLSGRGKGASHNIT